MIVGKQLNNNAKKIHGFVVAIRDLNPI